MTTPLTATPLQPGDRAPDLTVPAATREGLIALADYHGRSPILLALLRGLYWPFCRRHVVSLGLTSEKLREVGVETVAVVATPADRARRYFRYRPPRCLVGADHELKSHRAFGVPHVAMTDEVLRVVLDRNDWLARERGLQVPAGGGKEALNREDGIEIAEYMADMQHHQTQFTAEFLIDADGIIRWAYVECAREGLAGLDAFPSDEEVLRAARAL